MKDKRIEIRVSNDFYYMLTKVCERLNCSMTDYLTERALSQDIVQIVRTPLELETEHTLARISNNMNQAARTLNSLRTMIKEQNYIDQEYFETVLMQVFESLHEIRVDQLRFLDDVYEDQKLAFSSYKKRAILPEVEEVLQEIDRDYLEQIQNKENTL